MWLNHFQELPQPEAGQGVLDLRGTPLDQRPLALIGEWEYYPEQLLTPNDFLERDTRTVYYEPLYGHDPAVVLSGRSAYAGTYRLLLRYDKTGEPLGIDLPELSIASRVYVNGQLVAQTGEPSIQPNEVQRQAYPKVALFPDGQGEASIVLQVAGNVRISPEVMERPIRFGTYEQVHGERAFSSVMQFMLVVVLALHAIYAAILYGYSGRNRTVLYLFLLLVCSLYAFLMDEAKLLLAWSGGHFSYTWADKLKHVAYVWLFVLLVLLVFRLFRDRPKAWAIRLYTGVAALYCAFVLFASPERIHEELWAYQLLMTGSFLSVPVWIFRSRAWKTDPGFLHLAVAALAILSSSFWGSFRWHLDIVRPFYPFDLIVAFICMATYAFRRYHRYTVQTRELAAQLEAANKTKDQFLAYTSHELRHPLQGFIQITRQLAERSERLDFDAQRSVRLLLTVSKRMARLVDDLLDLSLLREGKVQLARSAVSVRPIAETILEQLRYLLDDKPVEIRSVIGDEIPRVWADETRLAQLLAHLVHNAVKFTHVGTIVLSAEANEDHVFLHVTDTGIGMDPQTVARVTTPYNQSGDFEESGEGGGLGLRICTMLAELHNGRLEVSSSPGQGTDVCLVLPVSKDESVALAAQEALFRGSDLREDNPGAAAPPILPDAHLFTQEAPLPQSADQRPRILVVDDDPVNLKLLSYQLPPEEYELAFAMNGMEALRLLERGSWDLVISDVMMPGMSGFELTRRIRSHYSMTELPVLLLATRTQPDDIEEGFRAGANDYTSKPVDRVEIRTRVDAQIHLKQAIAKRLELEAAYLQAQMHPHFLFNSLNSISALAEIDVHRMGELLDALSNYLRISFHSLNSEQFVPFEHELELVRAYLYIEQERFGERLRIAWELEEGLTFHLPPLTLQPLVENAVRHGVTSKVNGGTVVIRTVKRGDEVEVSVKDDGVGMDDEKMQEVFAASTRQSAGVGLANTDRRLKRLCGQGLKIESTRGEGTCVSFRVWLKEEKA
ncbi:ATP-binding protein [Gorillibacterium sp. CAU 1737]|uniref:ATP-binding response regulator n=1 Tax=Gorillibacterium sp. CAU 1737 TaxID=3140362 RepID=UPI003260F20A